MQQVIIEYAQNEVSDLETAVNERLKKLGAGWRIVSANTNVEVASVWQADVQMHDAMFMAGSPKSVIYVTTLVVEKND